MERRVNVKVQSELYDRVKAKAKELNISMGAFVRMALTEYLKMKGE